MMEPNSQVDYWGVCHSDPATEHPYTTVTIEDVALSEGNTISGWPKIHTEDYVNVMVLNADREVLVFEGCKQDVGRINWQLLGGYLVENEDPLTAVKRTLLEETGYYTTNWNYLGSYVLDANQQTGVGYLFCAQNVQKVNDPTQTYLESSAVKWVPLKDIRYALVDGRLAIMRHAMTASLAMLTLL